jgi:FdhE protein
LRKFHDLKADPTKIGNIAKPPFVRLPDPEKLFIDRAARFRQLAAGHDLGPYLEFLAGLCEVQAAVQDGLAEPAMPAPEILERAAEHEMPPLARTDFAPDAAFTDLFERLTLAAAGLDMPPEAHDALARIRLADEATRNGIIGNVLSDWVSFEGVAEHAFVAAVLQVHFARLAARLESSSLQPVGDGVCPACGGPPSTTMVVGWNGAHGTRFCSCSLCGTLWNYIRAKCTLCGSTEEISFQAVEAGPEAVKAETCSSCQGYVKVLYQDKVPAADPIADDVATLDLDLLVRELNFRRGGVNPFLIGY